MVTQVLENVQLVRRLSCNEFAGCKTPLAPNQQQNRRLSCFNSLNATQKTQARPLTQQTKQLSAPVTKLNQVNSNNNTKNHDDKWINTNGQRDCLSNGKINLSEEIAPNKLTIDDPNVPKIIRDYIERKAVIFNCKEIHVCDGSDNERKMLLDMMVEKKIISPLAKRKNCWLARTDPRDVARVESKTYICTRDKHDVVCRGAAKEGSLGNWMHVDELDKRMERLLPNCMAGRTMYVIPFSMGPIGSPLSKVGIQLTDSPYVVASMMIMTRVSRQIFQIINERQSDKNNSNGEIDFVRCIHTVGCPLPLKRKLINNWPCNPEETIISHIPERREIISYGSGYGGNSLLGKKCFALRLGSIMGHQEGWLAEHMLILAITNPQNVKRYIAAAFPSACGKTNLAMMTPTLPGYKIECVGDDIAWMRFDSEGRLRAINPEAGFFGVAPGTNDQSNPNAMRTIEENTIFTNVGETSEGDIYWEGLEEKLRDVNTLIDWQGNQWTKGDVESSKQKVAHPNSRFCCPASQCPIMDSAWESPEGVPISAIIFGGRRPEGVPLVYESRDWAHGVFMGASMRSESTAAAEHQGKTIMHDPFAMRPFFGYNFGKYLQHWLSFGDSKREDKLSLPKIFHVNWFRRDPVSGQFLWPGFGENSRVLDWIFRRCENESDCAQETPIGFIPTEGAINLDGLGSENIEFDRLFEISRDFWLAEQHTIHEYLEQNVGLDLPEEIRQQSDSLKKRLLE